MLEVNFTATQYVLLGLNCKRLLKDGEMLKLVLMFCVVLLTALLLRTLMVFRYI